MDSRRHVVGTFALACGVLLLAPRAHADDALSCHDRLVSLGDSAYQVQSICGVPDWVEHRTQVRMVRRPGTVLCRVGAGVGRCPALVDDSIEVSIDEWTYDFGPDRFIQYLTFEQGKLMDVCVGGYGHKQT
ncbi:MAG TPA: DUF2845 domain-containing protein [Polyangiales bacterium]